MSKETKSEALKKTRSSVLERIPKITFGLVLFITILTPVGPLQWLVEAFINGGTGARFQEDAPRLAQITDHRGLGHFERLSLNKWASASHIVPSLIWLAFWPIQFTNSFRWKSPWLHRSLGTLMIVDAACVLFGVLPMCIAGGCHNHKKPLPWPLSIEGLWSAPFGVWFYAYGVVSLYKAYTAARRHQYRLHRRWIIRLNAVFLGVTLSRWVFITSAILMNGDPRVNNLDFRWYIFWRDIWISMAIYVFLAEVWLAIESRFGLGTVHVRPVKEIKRS